MPCIDAGVVSYLFSAIGEHQAAIPSWNTDLLEPLMAVYRREAILEYLKTHESYSLRSMIRSIDTLYVPVDDLRQFDPELRSFTNINKLEDLEQINGDNAAL